MEITVGSIVSAKTSVDIYYGHVTELSNVSDVFWMKVLSVDGKFVTNGFSKPIPFHERDVVQIVKE